MRPCYASFDSRVRSLPHRRSHPCPRCPPPALAWQAGDACVIRAGRHTLTADEAASHGGTDTGPAPYELLVSALAACTAITLRMVAARKGWELGAIHVDVELEKDPATGADRISRVVSFGAALSGEQKAALAEIAEKTPVTKTIKAGAPVETKFV